MCFSMELKFVLFIGCEWPSMSTFNAATIFDIKLVINWSVFIEYNRDDTTKNTSPAPMVSITLSDINAGTSRLLELIYDTDPSLPLVMVILLHLTNFSNWDFF